MALQTGIDAQTLQKLESRVQEGFVDGLPPHLLPSARSLSYTPNSGQSRFFFCPHLEYEHLTAQEIQGVLHNRHILVPGHPMSSNHGWNLLTFGRLFDVDRPTTVHSEAKCSNRKCFYSLLFKVANYIDPCNPDTRHFQGTLCEIHHITTTFPSDSCPPVNAISLPTSFRNLIVPSQWDAISLHELAQSRVPPSYSTTFCVPDMQPHTEWSLIGGKDAVISMHMDTEGFGTVVVVLEGTKYWVIATQIGDDEDLCSINSLGAMWNPYQVNEGNKANCYRIEAVHLQKGDML